MEKPAQLQRSSLQQPTRGPAIHPNMIVGKGPVTSNAALNMGIGASVVGGSQAGFMAVTGGGQVLATSIFLNLVSQLIKDQKWFPEHKGLIAVMLILSFAVGFFIFYASSPDEVTRVGNSFMNMANSTMQAVLNYKGDKAAGLNALEPVPAGREFGGLG